MSDYDRIRAILDNQGIFYSEDIIDKDIITSLQYISVIIELENEFSIDFPDEYLADNVLVSISGIAEQINRIKGVE